MPWRRSLERGRGSGFDSRDAQRIPDVQWGSIPHAAMPMTYLLARTARRRSASIARLSENRWKRGRGEGFASETCYCRPALSGSACSAALRETERAAAPKRRWTWVPPAGQAVLRNSRFRIFPVAVMGSDSLTSTSRGYL